MHVARPGALAFCALTLIVGTGAHAEGAPRTPDAAERVTIGETIRAQLVPLQDCYTRRLERVPSLEGKLMLHFEIDGDGKVARPTADGMNDRPLVRCVLDEVGRWQFPKPHAGATLTVGYPVVFRNAVAPG